MWDNQSITQVGPLGGGDRETVVLPPKIGGFLDAFSPSNIHPLVRKLDNVFILSDEERSAVSRLPTQIANLRADQDIVRERDRPSRCCVILKGFACSYKITSEGKRQIFSFSITGDMPDLQSLHLRILDNSLGTITPCMVGFIQHEALRELCESYPRIAGALWRDTLIEAAVFREWMVSIGRRDAYSRIAHLFCELLTRMRVAGLAVDGTCECPITQTEIADALGLTTVHVNRTLRDLREAGLVAFDGRVLKVLEWDGLREAGGFDPIYLHIKTEEAAA